MLLVDTCDYASWCLCAYPPTEVAYETIHCLQITFFSLLSSSLSLYSGYIRPMGAYKSLDDLIAVIRNDVRLGNEVRILSMVY